jgi:Zn finger protein HypA/HybF involved in hydrogenase expression
MSAAYWCETCQDWVVILEVFNREPETVTCPQCKGTIYTRPEDYK